MISELFAVPVLIGLLTSGVTLATPYLYAAIGETFSQRSGVLNLGVEGQMLLGAFAAFYVTLVSGNLWLGVLAVYAWIMEPPERALWGVMLAAWAIGVTTLSWEHRKVGWLLAGLIMTEWARSFRRDQERA